MTTKLLAIDTSSSKCAVALSLGNKLTIRSSSADRQATRELLPMISELLADAAISLSDLDVIAVSAGPGSFTGIRIGIGVVQGLSFASNRPAIALSSLAVCAMAAIRETATSHLVVSQKARENEVYLAAYIRSERLGAELVGTEQVGAPEALRLAVQAETIDSSSVVAGLTNSSWSGVGDGWAYREQLEIDLGLKIQRQLPQPKITMEDVCALARLRFAAGEAVAPEQLRPNYIKEHMVYAK